MFNVNYRHIILSWASCQHGWSEWRSSCSMLHRHFLYCIWESLSKFVIMLALIAVNNFSTSGICFIPCRSVRTRCLFHIYVNFRHSIQIRGCCWTFLSFRFEHFCLSTNEILFFPKEEKVKFGRLLFSLAALAWFWDCDLPCFFLVFYKNYIPVKFENTSAVIVQHIDINKSDQQSIVTQWIIKQW